MHSVGIWFLHVPRCHKSFWEPFSDFLKKILKDIRKKNWKEFPWVGLEPSTYTLASYHAITSAIQPIDTRSPTTAQFIFIEIFQPRFSPTLGYLQVSGLGSFFTHKGLLSYCIDKPAVRWGPGVLAFFPIFFRNQFQFLKTLVNHCISRFFPVKYLY